MVTAVDEAIGELYSELDKLGLLENAIIAFTSDVQLWFSFICNFCDSKNEVYLA